MLLQLGLYREHATYLTPWCSLYVTCTISSRTTKYRVGRTHAYSTAAAIYRPYYRIGGRKEGRKEGVAVKPSASLKMLHIVQLPRCTSITSKIHSEPSPSAVRISYPSGIPFRWQPVRCLLYCCCQAEREKTNWPSAPV